MGGLPRSARKDPSRFLAKRIAKSVDLAIANGFVRSSNVVQQRYVVQVIRFGATPTIERHFVDNGALELDVDGSKDRKAPILAVSALAPRSTQTTGFTVSVTAKQ